MSYRDPTSDPPFELPPYVWELEEVIEEQGSKDPKATPVPTYDQNWADPAAWEIWIVNFPNSPIGWD